MANRLRPEMAVDNMLVDDRLGPQLPLALRALPDQRLERYLRAPEGLLEQLRALASGDMVDALYLQGAAATGKTHLLLGSCTLATSLGKQAAYLPLGNVRGRLRVASEGLDADLVAVDDVDAIAGHRADEVALLAVRQVREQRLLAPELAAPLYVRDKVAFTTAERLARGGKA